MKGQNAVTNLPELTKTQLTRLAMVEYNAGRTQNSLPPVRAADLEPTNLDRIMVNYLRHRATHYDTTLNGRRRNGRSARLMLWSVNAEIAKRYPFLKSECMRQIRAKSSRYGAK
jgi:hypothetical protein